jgi:hypothetical protein
MLALRSSSLSALMCSRKHVRSIAPQYNACWYASRVKRLFSGLSIAVLLLWCSRGAYGATFGVTEMSVNASNSDDNLRLSDRSAFQCGLTGTIVLAGAVPTISSNHRNLAWPGANLLRVSSEAEVTKLLPVVPLGGLPIVPAALLWFPETDEMSDLRMTRSSTRSISSKAQRTIRIGMFLLFAMGLLGMLFGCGARASKPTGGQYNVTIPASGATAQIRPWPFNSP